MQEKIFKFGSIELTGLVNDKDDWYFHGSVVCIGCKLISEQSNASKYIKDNVPTKWRRVIRGKTGRGAYYVTEPGLYKLILSATSTEGIEFSDWVVEVVLPSIRKDNSYVDEKNITLEQLEKLEQTTSELKQLRLDKARLQLENQVLNDQQYKAVEKITAIKAESETEANILISINDSLLKEKRKLEYDLYMAQNAPTNLSMNTTLLGNETIERTYSENEYQKLKKEIKSLREEIHRYRCGHPIITKFDQLMRFVLTSRPTPLRKQIMLLFGWNEKTPLPKDNF